jgi:hypothetical protein
MQFAGTTETGVFVGCGVNSGLVWSGDYIVSHVRQFATMNYHTGRRKEDDKHVVIQLVREVQRFDPSIDTPFTFPLEKHHDEAFDAPDGWLDSYWREPPPPVVIPTGGDIHDDSAILDEWLSLPYPIPPIAIDAGWIEPKPAVVVPTDTGFVTVRPQLEAVNMANDSDLESALATAEWAQLENMRNLHELSYVVWIDELFQGQIFELSTDERWLNKRIGEGPPMNLVVARTFLDVAIGRMC